MDGGNADIIICQDVLEHIPENILPEVIKEISTISKNVYFNINHIKPGNILPNGEDTYCTIKQNKWIKTLIEKYFENHKI